MQATVDFTKLVDRFKPSATAMAGVCVLHIDIPRLRDKYLCVCVKVPHIIIKCFKATCQLAKYTCLNFI